MSIDDENGSPPVPDSEMQRILETMLEGNQTITARGVAKRHSSIRHASSITRHLGRRELLERFQAMQRGRREWLLRIPKRSKAKVAAELAQKAERITELEREIEILRASHVAMLRAVGELGGTSKWLKFFDDYRGVREKLREMGLLPETEVKQIRPRT